MNKHTETTIGILAALSGCHATLVSCAPKTGERILHALMPSWSPCAGQSTSARPCTSRLLINSALKDMHRRQENLSSISLPSALADTVFQRHA